MAINVTDFLFAKTKKGKLGKASLIFLEDDTTNLLKKVELIDKSIEEIQDNITEETQNRQNIDGIKGNTYTSNIASTYLKEATSLNNADLKLDTAISNEVDRAKKAEVVLLESINKKVDKVSGKQLSTNDFTNEYKEKLDSILNGAEVNVIKGIKGNAEYNYRTGYVNITPENIGAASDSIATQSSNGLMSAADKIKLDNLVNGNTDVTKGSVTGVKGEYESSYRTGNVNITKANIGLSNVDNTSDYDKPLSYLTQLALNNKVDKEAGKGLSSNDFTDELKGKLNQLSISDGGTTILSGVAGVKGNTELTYRTGYVNITPADIGAASNNVATTSSNGLMSASDKAKLDSIGTTSGGEIVDGSITTAKLANSAVTAIKIADNTITEDKLSVSLLNKINSGGSGTGGSGEITNGSVTSDKLASSAVTTEKIAYGAVTTEKLASNSVTSEKIVDGSINTSDIADLAITGGKLASNAITSDKLDSYLFKTVLGVSGAYLGTIVPSSSPVINSGTTSSDPYYNQEIRGWYIATEAGTYTNFKLPTGEAIVVENSALLNIIKNVSDGRYTHEAIAIGGGGTGEAGEITDGSITAAKLAASSVTNAKIASGAVTLDKLDESLTLKLDSLDAYSGLTFLGEITSKSLTPVLAEFLGEYHDKPGFYILNYNTKDSTDLGGSGIITSLPNFGYLDTTPDDGDLAVFIYSSGSVGSITWKKSAAIKGGTGTTDITDGSITTAKLADEAVTTDKIAGSAVLEYHILNSTITSRKLANGIITNNKMANDAISTSNIISSAVTTDKLANYAVGTLKIANNAVTYEKLSTDLLDRIDSFTAGGGDGTVAAHTHNITDLNLNSNNMYLFDYPIVIYNTDSRTGGIIINSSVGGLYNDWSNNCLGVMGDKVYFQCPAYFSRGLTDASDIRLKNIIDESAVLPLNYISEAPIIRFSYKEDESNKIHRGTSALYWEEITGTDFINKNKHDDGEEYLSIESTNLSISIGISLAKHLDLAIKRIEELETKVTELESKLNNN